MTSFEIISLGDISISLARGHYQFASTGGDLAETETWRRDLAETWRRDLAETWRLWRPGVNRWRPGVELWWRSCPGQLSRKIVNGYATAGESL
jgi:hypothetical protein